MPLFPASPARGCVPVLNSACPWASSEEDLRALWECEWTSAVTTRTTTLHGFPDDPSKHQVAFFGSDAQSSANSFGYSPFPLSTYVSWLRPLVLSTPPAKRKQLIVSITGTLSETAALLAQLRDFAAELDTVLAVEFNASCPNLGHLGHAPPAYVEDELQQFLALLAEHASDSLKVGVKLPPYTYDEQFAAVGRALSSVGDPHAKEHPISFLTATNTLGQGLVFGSQMAAVPSCAVAQQPPKQEMFALPGGSGGLAGAAIHHTSLGNVYRLSRLLRDEGVQDRRLRSISLIGVGGASDAESVERFRLAGADAVACATALGREGVRVFEKMAGGRAPMRVKL
ncbi:hypothetical protein Rhopal_003762-T1 [Rhodotorula paludigena]|uniref:Dihydroorotate oxidase n=1 Tax=Rhodotorula paludigena TaxID=86838 RepID=A0AAV5GKL3_9BASI|nr:hypothetical protein Rhopal_003762-T1 [Rhodotorula paludigena]